jgi:hypothetical protein
MTYLLAGRTTPSHEMRLPLPDVVQCCFITSSGKAMKQLPVILAQEVASWRCRVRP